MKLNFNLKYSFGDNLREVPEDPVQFDLAIKFLLNELKDNQDDLSLARIHSKVGSLLQIRGRLDESLHHHEAAEQLLDRSQGPRLYQINRIRLATAHQFAGSYSTAIEILSNCVEELKGENVTSNLLDFAYQHLGKTYFDKGDKASARAALKEAEKLRRLKGDEELLASTIKALMALDGDS